MSPRNQLLKVPVHLPVLLNDFFDRLTSFFILFERTLDEHVSKVCVWDLLLSYLDSGPAFKLQTSNCLSSLPNDQADAFIGHRNNISLHISLDS